MKFSARKACVAVAVVACTFALTACKPGAKQALRLNLQPGGSYQLLLRESTESDLSNDKGKSVTVTSATEFAFSIKPGELKDNGDITAAVTVQKVNMPAILHQIEAAFASYSFNVDISPLGHVVSLSNTEGLNDAALKLAKDNGAQQSADDVLRSLLEPVLAVWPSVPVAPGDTWTRSGLVYPRRNCIEDTVFTVESISGGMAVVSMKSTFKPLDAARPTSGSGTGEVRISTADGTVRAYKMSITTEGSVTRADNGQVVNVAARSEVQGELTAR